MRWRIALIAGLLGAHGALASQDYASVRDLPDEVKNLRKGRLSNADITLNGVRIGREALTSVVTRFGAAEPYREPGSASAAREVCYETQRGGRPVWIVFGSGPLGSWERITHFQVLSGPPAKLRCASSSLGGAPIATDGGTRLGMRLGALRSRLGRPTEQGNGYLAFSWEQKNPGNPDFDMLSVLRATTRDERITSFEVSLVESN